MKRIALLASAALSSLVLIAGAGVSTAQVGTVAKLPPKAVGRSAAAQVPPQMRAWLSRRVPVTRNPYVATRSSVATGFRNPQAPTVQVGGNPVAVAVNAATNTVYVGNGNDGSVSVVDGTDCNADNTSGCGHGTATIQLGNGANPVDAVTDVATNTVYVTDVSGNSIFVIDGTICNAHEMAGCGQTPASIVVGSSPDGLVFNQRTHTLYVANANDGTLSVIDTSTCNASNHSGCGQTPPTVRVGSSPGVPALNKATNTLYVPNSGDATVSAVNISACRAGTTSGCGQTPRTISVGPNTFSAAVDPTTNTVYVTSARVGADTNRGSLYVINGATCNATIVSGCRQMPTRVTVGSIPIGVIQDPVTRNVFVLNEEDSSVSILDGAGCNAQHLAGCGKPALTLNVGRNGGYFDVNPATGTLYVSSQNDNTISVLDTGACSINHRSGCRIAARTSTVGTAPQGAAANPVTNTIYVGNRTDGTLSVIDGGRCNATNRAACHQPWPTVPTGQGPQSVAVNPRTNTIYTANVGVEFAGGDTVSVVDGATCNAQVRTGCGKPPATITVGDYPISVAVNPATDTIYVANAGADFNGTTVSVIDGASCNGHNHTGCNSPGATIHVGHLPTSLAIDTATNTIYVANLRDNTVSVIDGSTCNGTLHTGCAQTPPAFTAASVTSVAVHHDTHTVYVAGYDPGTITVIDQATCRATHTTGCRPLATISAPNQTGTMTVDPRTGTIFTDRSNYGSDVWVFNGSTCNATNTTGCRQSPMDVPVGGWPADLTINPSTSTLYVPDETDGLVSLFGYSRGAVYP